MNIYIYSIANLLQATATYKVSRSLKGMAQSILVEPYIRILSLDERIWNKVKIVITQLNNDLKHIQTNF